VPKYAKKPRPTFTARELFKMLNLTYLALQNASYQPCVTAPNNDHCGSNLWF